MQAFECTGQWWLPEKDKEAAVGTLKVSQSGNLRLWLVGALGQPMPFHSKSYPVILGWVDKSLYGDRITLSNCMLGGSTVGSSTNTRENYHASRAYFGAHLWQQDDFAFKSTSLHVTGLSEWAHNYSGFVNENFPFGKPDEPTSVLSYAHNEPLVASIPDGHLTFSLTFRSWGSLRERSFGESLGLSIACESEKSADQLNTDYVNPLQNLMTFVCDRPQEVEEFSVWARGLTTRASGPMIRVIGPRVQPEDEGGPPEPVRHFQMLFTLEDVDFPSFAGNWLRVSDRYADAFSFFFGLEYGPPAFIDLAFPSVVQALHLYYSRRDDGAAARAAEEGRLRGFLSSLPAADADWIVDRLEGGFSPPLKVVLSKLVEEHAHVMNRLVANRQDRFVAGVINTLKYIQTRDPVMYGAAGHGADLYWTMQKLRFLFKACLLRELGFSHEKAVAQFDRNGLYRHVCELEAAEEARRQQA
jgi:hypothetical protein